MKEIYTIFLYELKKIFRKKVTWITLALLGMFQLFFAISGNLGSTYVDGQFLETHATGNAIRRQNGILLSGTLIDDALLSNIEDAFSKLDTKSATSHMFSDIYQEEVRRYSDLYNNINFWMGNNGESISFPMNATQLYEQRKIKQETRFDLYPLTQTEEAYWREKDAQLPDVFTYDYAASYQSLIDMNGGYMICMLAIFFAAICMGSIFTDEHTQKTDQLILSTQNGRAKLYCAKILAGSATMLLFTLLLVLLALFGNFICYGTEGFDAMLQVTTAFWYSYPLTIGETFLITLGILFLSTILTGLIAMVLAIILNHSIGTMAIVVASLFLSRLIYFPPSFGLISKIWNYIPINLLKIDQGFLDLRLVSFGNISLTVWQFAPILYLLLAILIAFIGAKVFCRQEIKGR